LNASRVSLAALAALALAGAGCGSDPADADREEIAAVLNQLFDAQDAGDAETACSDVYVIQEPWEVQGETAAASSGESAEAEAEAGAEGEGGEAGLQDCEAAFEQADELRRSQVRRLSTDVGAIELDGERATATVHTELTRPDGSALSQEVPYDLVHTPEGWRIRISEEG
jgi:hypothetical protein